MDDILASIRKILNEDEASAGPAVKPEAPAEPLLLTEEMLVTQSEAPAPESAPLEAASTPVMRPAAAPELPPPPQRRLPCLSLPLPRLCQSL